VWAVGGVVVFPNVVIIIVFMWSWQWNPGHHTFYASAPTLINPCHSPKYLSNEKIASVQFKILVAYNVAWCVLFILIFTVQYTKPSLFFVCRVGLRIGELNIGKFWRKQWTAMTKMLHNTIFSPWCWRSSRMPSFSRSHMRISSSGATNSWPPKLPLVPLSFQYLCYQ
jgi:hypothetical protein